MTPPVVSRIPRARCALRGSPTHRWARALGGARRPCQVAAGAGDLCSPPRAVIAFCVTVTTRDVAYVTQSTIMLVLC
jgi:hypothetical protein